ncbi:Fc.00g096980.m01.CDS01 [Cosmosporella sp. VM-42]
MADSELLETGSIGHWRSIVTLIAFVVANVLVLFPFHIPVYVPAPILNLVLSSLCALRVIPASLHHGLVNDPARCSKHFVRFRFPVNFITAPLIADLFLLAISAIGRQEVRDGTIGANNISPIDIMIFFITLAYIAISIDASGLIRFLAFKVLQWGGKVGHKLFFYLYAFFFVLGSFIGNDPIILSGTAFLAYMTRVSKNITSPRAWIHTQFAVANIASAILVSSNPTNLVLAGAFDIKFIDYTANMIVPVVITAVVLFPFLLYVVFANEDLIPSSIEMHTLSAEAQDKRPVNPNIPYVRRQAEEQDSAEDGKQGMVLSLEEIMNPFLDKKGAAFGAVIMAATLVTLLALNAASQSSGEHPVFWVTLPAAFVLFCWDLAFGWLHRHETRETAAVYRQEVERARAERRIRILEETNLTSQQSESELPENHQSPEPTDGEQTVNSHVTNTTEKAQEIPLADLSTEKPTGLRPSIPKVFLSANGDGSPILVSGSKPQSPILASNPSTKELPSSSDFNTLTSGSLQVLPDPEVASSHDESSHQETPFRERERATVISLLAAAYEWLQVTFPTVMAVMAHLPFALVPFAFSMFVLVQALVTKGWVHVFARGWDHWVNKTGTIGGIGGMGFLSVILCNFCGTNIGTTILLCRVIQSWQEIHLQNGNPISNREFWATVYSMALGVNYGAFSTAFSASLAGLLWRDILARKHIHVKTHEFARVNFPIIAISMSVGCIVLIGEIYITRDNSPFKLS